MKRWPTVEALAAATEDEVLRQWQGLGYYSRARNLLTAARQVTAQGGFPSTFKELLTLKGVGTYTAAAIASIAFDEPVAVVDGNVYRVLARYFGISTPINSTEGKKEFALLAQNLLPPQEPAAYNQALMDFGAMQCTPASPACHHCPLMETCSACQQGNVSDLPVKLRTLKVKERHFSYIYIRYKGQTALRRRPSGDIWQGLYEPLLIEDGVLDMEPVRLLRQNVKHVLTHRVIYADFWLWQPESLPTLPDGYFWIDECDLSQYAVPRLVELLLNEVNGG
jgi:A/G-specific adenine glycosylase